MKNERAKIYCTSREDSFALLRNGKVTTWGRYNPGQKNTELLSEGIIKIMTTQSSFLALREDRNTLKFVAQLTPMIQNFTYCRVFQSARFCRIWSKPR